VSVQKIRLQGNSLIGYALWCPSTCSSPHVTVDKPCMCCFRHLLCCAMCCVYVATCWGCFSRAWGACPSRQQGLSAASGSGTAIHAAGCYITAKLCVVGCVVCKEAVALKLLYQRQNSSWHQCILGSIPLRLQDTLVWKMVLHCRLADFMV
jgi:hypothetical protein